MATKNQLLEQARQLGLSGLSRMTKAELQNVLTNNPCHHLDVETCRTMSREELRGIARKCKVIMGRNTQDQICQDIYDKFHGQVQPNDPCYQLDVGTCRTMPREELRRNARKCKVIMGRKSQDQICQEIYDKFHAESPRPRRQRSPPRARTGPQTRARTRVRPTPKAPTPPRSPKAPTPPPRTRSRARTPPRAATPPPRPRARTPPRAPTPPPRSRARSPPKAPRQRSPPKALRQRIATPPRSPPPKARSPPPKARSPPRSSRSTSTPQQFVTPPQSLPKASTATQTIVHAQTNLDTAVKNQAAKTFTASLTTNFTRVAAYNENPKHQFEFKSCDIKVDRITELENTSQSSAGVYIAKSILSNTNDLILKMWVDRPQSWEVRCLNAEWAIYTYIIPFLFYRLITPCVLIPFQTGVCTPKDFASQILPRIRLRHPTAQLPRINHSVRYIATPLIPISLREFAETNQPQFRHPVKSQVMYALMFQLVYTITAFAALGLRHNDCHTNNVRLLCDPNRTNFKMGFELEDGKTRIYNTSPVLAVFFDFDRMGVDRQWSARLRNVCTQANQPYCTLNQCDTSIGGRRDLLILAIQMYNYLLPDFKKYVMDNILSGTPLRFKRLMTYIHFHNNEVDWARSDYVKFIFTELPDDAVVRIYPTSTEILHDPKFLQLCLTDARFLTTSTSAKKDFTMYSYKNKFSEFNDFIRHFHKII